MNSWKSVSFKNIDEAIELRKALSEAHPQVEFYVCSNLAKGWRVVTLGVLPSHRHQEIDSTAAAFTVH
jgi:hypothetical protein